LAPVRVCLCCRGVGVRWRGRRTDGRPNGRGGHPRKGPAGRSCDGPCYCRRTDARKAASTSGAECDEAGTKRTIAIGGHVVFGPGRQTMVLLLRRSSLLESFNSQDEELYPQFVTNAAAYSFLQQTVPLSNALTRLEEILLLPLVDVSEAHQANAGWVRDYRVPAKVGWAGKHNTINCPRASHYEGRWLADPRYLDDYSLFCSARGEPRR